jgi:ADP-ribose pyrophosphatase YjhB (NUDIX family)
MLQSRCSFMGRSYPSRPVAGVGAILLDGDEVLLVRRGRPPQQGSWSIPGGAVELGESLTEAVEREVREECGLEARAVELIEVFERIIRDEAGRVEYHYVLMDYLCELTGGALCAGDDAADAAWTPLARLAELRMTGGTAAVIQKAVEARDRRLAPAP